MRKKLQPSIAEGVRSYLKEATPEQRRQFADAANIFARGQSTLHEITTKPVMPARRISCEGERFEGGGPD